METLRELVSRRYVRRETGRPLGHAAERGYSTFFFVEGVQYLVFVAGLPYLAFVKMGQYYVIF